VIVAGYQGMSYKREITTLGRGGSDTTAVALAAALSAERCEIYSDVDGIYSADPRSVPDARHLPELDFTTMQEMAECGAKVLHARAVEWAKQQKIAIHARKTDDYAVNGSGPETRVQERANESARAIVVDRRLALLRCPHGQVQALLAACGDAELALRDSVFQGEAFCATLPLSAVPAADASLAQLQARVAGLEVTRNVGTVSSVGVGVGADTVRLAGFLDTLGTPPLLLVGNPLRITALLPEAALAAAERALHARL
jgi:aspartate kinase